ncbi:triose-phosphate isomerase [Enterobacteriaceae endosymbiont of Plateumaris consimilis]|uniref:triose-phosphate isomerase n=1 Tax=Enterobacteriaceae endosymbiont of Plateumaris consimilis TaxID=2675794 RepID=UPI001449D46F|nr:triose-phosphate isomerase [Enterobacteriaceae endosymbiont of Plateumaris consimilis]QJC28608.1 triose-phosphate isomerase [Enterobacteriaceae endosymbiont of Plateumaris consimilis]
MKQFLIVGNWKLNGNVIFVQNYINKIKKFLNIKKLNFCKISIAPSYTYLYLSNIHLKNNQMSLTAQNVDIHLSGSFTGEISINMLKDMGVKYVIVGHSERRIFHKETNQYISEKFHIIKSHGLIPILCLGETEIQRNMNQTKDICAKQIDIILDTYGIEEFNNTVIAYEPIWAIGSGKSADPIEVQKIHKFIKEYIAQKDYKVSKNIIIQYGGSINKNNMDTFIRQKDINGFLIGKASLTAENFISIVKKAEKIISSI